MQQYQQLIKRAINRYFIAQMFLTRLPTPSSVEWSEEELAASTIWFPAVGVVIGVIASVAWLAANALWGTQLAAIAAVAAAIIATGAFHEDGLADSADGLGGAFDVQKKLSIMRDSRIGTYGSVALITVVLAKAVALANAPSQGTTIIGMLISAHVIARWTSLPLIYNNAYVREQGTGKPFAATVTLSRVLYSSFFTLLIVVLCVQMKTIYLLVTVVAFLLLAQTWLRRQLGGITGDTLGAVNSLAELLVYLVLTAHI